MKSISYKQATCCSDIDCYLLDADSEICWGQVYVISEEYTEDDYWWVHACEGHEDLSGKYKPETDGI